MGNWPVFKHVRREYGVLNLKEEDLYADPFLLFKKWFEDVLKQEINDPTAMVLSTVDVNGLPNSRVVLLKGMDAESFVFYTNYESIKGEELAHLPYAALNFYWPIMARQIRVRGPVQKISPSESDEYFASRPLSSQLGALASPQSHEIKDRAGLESTFNHYAKIYDKKIERPAFWGGYRVIAQEMEFWQGRDNRLHDRIQYFKKKNAWVFRRLAP